jgi:hypothetical protein
MAEPNATPDAAPRVDMCPIRPGEPCRLCFPGANGPSNCGLVYLVLSDPSLREQLERLWADHG